MVRLGQARLLGRPRKRTRFDMQFSPDEAEAYEYAQDTQFAALASDIADDPTGRGRVRAVSPLQMRTPVEATDMAFTPEEVAKREAPRSPLAMYSHSNPAPKGPWDVKIGDATITREPPAPPEPDAAATEAASATKATEVQAEANRPNYGRVTPESIEAGTAGDAPQRGDKWLAGLRGVGSVLMAAGGNSKGAMQEGMNAYRDYQSQEADYRDWTERNANLKRDAAKEQRGENRYAGETNYGRERDEDATVRYDQGRSDQQSAAAAARAERDAERAYERDPARRAEELEGYRGKKQIDAEFARKHGAGGGRSSEMQRDAAYKSMMASAQELYPDGVPQNVQNEIALRAMGKDPVGEAADFTGKLRGARGTETAKAATAAAKADAAAAEAESSVRDLRELEKSLERRIDAGSRTLPDTFPGEGAARTVAGAAKQVASGLGFNAFDERPAQKPGETPEQYEARLGEYKRSELGPTGYSQDESTINSFGRLMGRSYYNTSTDNSANLTSEQRVADEWARSNSSPEAMLERVRAQIAAEEAAVKTGRHRAARGMDGAPAAAGAVPPPPPGFELENP
jgi:hypothetical protein